MFWSPLCSNRLPPLHKSLRRVWSVGTQIALGDFRGSGYGDGQKVLTAGSIQEGAVWYNWQTRHSSRNGAWLHFPLGKLFMCFLGECGPLSGMHRGQEMRTGPWHGQWRGSLILRVPQALTVSGCPFLPAFPFLCSCTQSPFFVLFVCLGFPLFIFYLDFILMN